MTEGLYLRRKHFKDYTIKLSVTIFISKKRITNDEQQKLR